MTACTLNFTVPTLGDTPSGLPSPLLFLWSFAPVTLALIENRSQEQPTTLSRGRLAGPEKVEYSAALRTA
jgi:hypothetical protein